MSVSGRCSEISCADDTNASLEHIMVEFTASTCPSLRGKPWLFFLQHFKGTSWVNDECSIFASRNFTEKDTVRVLCIFTSQWERQLPRRSRLSAYLCDFYISSWSTQQRTRVFVYPAEGSVIIHRRGGGEGGGALEDFGGESRCFQGRKDGGRSSLTEHHEGLLKIDCKWGGIIRMLQGHRGIR